MRPCPIFDWSLRAPQKLAVVTQSENLSYLQLNECIQAYCGYISSLNLPPQSKLPFIALSNLETVCFFFAAWRMQMIACPISFRLPELAIEQTLKRLSAPLITPHPSHIKKVTEIDENLLSTMLLTSGSTGTPKIACHRLRHHLVSAEHAISHLHLEPDDYYLASLPLFHIGGIALLLRTFLAGATLMITDNYFERRVTHLSLVPTQLYRLLKEKIAHFQPKCILLGGAPIPPLLYQEAADLNLLTTYGMTEASSIITLNGKLLDHLELKIGDGEEILIRGKSIFEGYLNPDGTIVSPLQDGWFHTKDRGRMTPQQTLQLLGRKDRLFISGGENIQPEEIEEAILALFQVQQATVLPHHDEEFGMRPAVYLYDPNRTITLELLQTKLRQLLPGYKIPQKLFYLDQPTSKLHI